MNKNLFLIAAIMTVALLNPALANDLPWESGLEKLQGSLTGPVATGISLIGIVASGGMLIFGGEISGFLKSVLYIVLVVALIMCGNKILAVVGEDNAGSSGATISYFENEPMPFIEIDHVYVITDRA